MLEFKNASISVGNTLILEGISASFKKGKITVIVGPNGCGKTTLLQTLNGMSRLSSGEILLDGKPYKKMPLKERARRLSFLPQFHENAPGLTVRGLVEHGRFPYMGFSRKMGEKDIEAVTKAMEFTAVSDYRNRLLVELSGGLRQRAYLAMQLAQDSDYLVMDEPMNYLDFPACREMYKLIKKLKETGKTIILVLHDLSQALKIADEIIVIGDRKVVFSGTPKEALLDKTLEKVFECEIKEVNVDGTDQYVFI